MKKQQIKDRIKKLKNNNAATIKAYGYNKHWLSYHQEIKDLCDRDELTKAEEKLLIIEKAEKDLEEQEKFEKNKIKMIDLYKSLNHVSHAFVEAESLNEDTKQLYELYGKELAKRKMLRNFHADKDNKELLDQENYKELNKKFDLLETELSNCNSIGKKDDNSTQNSSYITIIKEIQSNSINAGTFEANTWQHRKLNRLEGDVSEMQVELISETEFKIPKGRYYVEAHIPAVGVGNHIAKLHSITVGKEYPGSSSYCNGQEKTYSIIKAYINIEKEAIFTVQHKGERRAKLSGLGKAARFDVDEIYSQIKIIKLGEYNG